MTAALRIYTALAILLYTTACSNTQSTKSPALPTLKQIKSRLVAPTDPYPNSLQPRPRVLVYAMSIPLAPLPDEARQMLATNSLCASSVALWRTNGLRIGAIEASRLQEFLDLVEPPVGIKETLIYGSRHYTPLAFSSPLRNTVDILFSSTQGKKQLRLNRGRAQFLIRLRQDEKNQATLEIVPHHHVNKFTITPRSPLEKTLDGRVFDQLKMIVPMQTNRLIVIALDLPARPKPSGPRQEPDADNKDHKTAHVGPTEPLTGQLSLASPQPASMPIDLGQLLLAVSRLHQPYQVIVIFRMDQSHPQIPPDPKTDR